MQADELKEIIMGILFVNGDAVAIKTLATSLEQDTSVIREVVKNLEEDLSASHLGLEITHVASGIQLTTKPKIKPYIDKFFGSEARKRLTRAALETLAIIAYRQPITRVEIEEIRGVKVDRVLYSLMERELIKSVGKKDVPGKPVLFGTTDKFLQHFGLNALDELPHPEEFHTSLFDYSDNHS